MRSLHVQAPTKICSLTIPLKVILIAQGEAERNNGTTLLHQQQLEGLDRLAAVSFTQSRKGLTRLLEPGRSTSEHSLALFLRTLRQPFLDTRFRTSGDSFTRIVERPGRWMAQKDLDSLSRDLCTVAGKTLPAGSLNYGVFSADKRRMDDSIVTVVYRKQDGQPIAFNALAIMDVQHNGKLSEVLHLGLVMVDPDVRGRGFSWVLYGLTCVILFVRNGLRPLHVSNVTQVPAVVGMVGETFSEVYPRPGDGPPKDFAKVQLARAIMAGHRHVFGVGEDAVFDERSFVIQNAYTGGSDHLKKTFDESSRHRDEAYNGFCEERLDYQRGDDFLQIGKIDLNAVRRYVTRSVPRGSLAGIASLAALVLLRRVVLPVLHWLDDTRPFGPLRPWKR